MACCGVCWYVLMTYALVPELTPRRERRMNSFTANRVTSNTAITNSWTGLVFPSTAPKEIRTEPVQKSALIMLQKERNTIHCTQNQLSSKSQYTLVHLFMQSFNWHLKWFPLQDLVRLTLLLVEVLMEHISQGTLQHHSLYRHFYWFGNCSSSLSIHCVHK